MEFNIALLVDLFWPVAILLLGVFVNRHFERRPKIVTFAGHVSSFNVRANPDYKIYTHSIVIRNAGGKTAENVRVGHWSLPPNFQVFPPTHHEVEEVDGGVNEIVIPQMVPNEQVSISYLYFQPITLDRIHAYVKSDQGFARQVPVLQVQQYPKWVYRVVGALAMIGVFTVAYLATYLLRSLY